MLRDCSSHNDYSQELPRVNQKRLEKCSTEKGQPNQPKPVAVRTVDPIRTRPKLKREHFHTSRCMDTSWAQSVNILETFNTCQYIIYISAPTISTSLDFRDLVPVNGRLMCIAYVQTWFRSLGFSLSRSVVTPGHRCVIMNKVVNESLRKICHYQQNVPQH